MYRIAGVVMCLAISMAGAMPLRAAPSKEQAAKAKSGKVMAAPAKEKAASVVKVSKKPTSPVVTQYGINAQSSQASFEIDEVLRGSPFTVVGTTKDVTGTISVDMTTPEKSSVGIIKIDARTLKTDSPQRDGAIGRFILHSSDSGNQYIIFAAKKVSGLPKVISKAPMNLTLTGDLTISGKTKPATFEAKSVTITNGSMKGMAQAKIKRSDYGLFIPSIPFVADVPDEFTIKIDLTAAQVKK